MKISSKEEVMIIKEDTQKKEVPGRETACKKAVKGNAAVVSQNPGPGLGRQPSTERTPENLQRSRSDAGYYPHRAESESRGHSFESSFSTSVEKSREESPGPASVSKIEVSRSPRSESEASSYQSHETEHIAKKKRAMFSVM